MVFQPIRFTPPAVACTDRELLPRVFTLTPPRTRGGGNFLWHCLSLRLLYPESLPVRKYGALCCPDFPPRQRRGDRTNCCWRKGTKFPQGFKILNPCLIIHT